MNKNQHHSFHLHLLQGEHAREAAALYHDLHTHLYQNHKKLEGGSPHHQTRLQMSEYRCEMPKHVVLYNHLLSIKNIVAASLPPPKFIQILFVASMNLEPHSTGDFETFLPWLR